MADPATLYGKRDNSDDIITAASVRLASLGVPANHFVVDSYLKVGYLPKLFAKHLKIFNGIKEDEHLKQLLQLGVNLGFFTTLSNCPAQGFYDFMRFLRRPEGQREMTQLARQRRMLKRARPNDDNNDVTYVHFQNILEHQSIDSKHAEGDVQARHKPIIEDLKAQIRVAKANLEDLEAQLQVAKANLEQELETTKASFRPWCEFPAVEKASFNRQCWQIYIAECASKGVESIELNKPNLEAVVSHYEDRVREDNIKTFLTPARRDQLTEYVRTQIAHFEPSHEKKEAPAEVPTQAPPSDGGEDTGGATPTRDEEHFFNAVDVDVTEIFPDYRWKRKKACPLFGHLS